MTHHTAQRCSAVLEQSKPSSSSSLSMYEALHEQHSGHEPKSPSSSSILLAARATPCLVENNSNEKDNSDIEQNYPQHLNPFSDEPGYIKQWRELKEYSIFFFNRCNTISSSTTTAAAGRIESEY